jgi:GT2 family glycosyltransferase
MITASLVLYKTKEEELRRVLLCVEKSIIDKVYVVDNSPTDSLKAIVEELNYKKVDYCFGQGNVGFGSGNNIGMRYAQNVKSKYHIILNPDIIFKNDAIVCLHDFLDNNKDVALVAPQLHYPNGNPQSAAMLLPTPLVIFGRRFLPDSVVQRINGKYEFLSYDMSKPREVPNVCGCFMMLRTSVLEDSGLFDERFFMYFEDFDFVRRVNRYGKVVYYPYADVIHAHGNAHRKNKALLKAGLKSGIQYFNKWGWFFDRERHQRNKYSLSEKSVLI